jgi:hypothetical protein
MKRMDRLPLSALAAAALVAGLPARADSDGYAEAGARVMIGTFAAAPGAADTTDPVFAGQSAVDGVVTLRTAPPGALSLEALSGRANGIAGATVTGSAQTLLPAAPGGAPLPLDGWAAAEADRNAGTLRLAATTTSAFVSLERNGNTFVQQAGSYAVAAARIQQGFDVFVDATRPVPPTITLTLKLDGTMASNPDFGWTNGVRAALHLGNVVAPGGSILDTFRDFEGAVTNDTLTLAAPVANLQCPTGRAYCESFVTLVARIEIYGRDGQGNSAEGNFAGAFGGHTQLDWWHTASLTLTSSDGSELRRVERPDSFAWVNPASPVPEPATATVLSAGLAALALRMRRRRR